MDLFPAKEGVPGFVFSGIKCGIKPDAPDLGLIACDRPCSAAGVFTTNRVKAAPVLLGKRRVAGGSLQAVLVNSGNANACTGSRGMASARNTCRHLAACLAIPETLVVPCSTGVIGVQPPEQKICDGLSRLIKQASPQAISSFARSIMTTDTRSKIVSVTDRLNGKRVKMCGVAKGSGMIMPDMATMLSFIVTDAAVKPCILSELLTKHTEKTFNRITVDGDTSTNDTVLLLASGRAETVVRPSGSASYGAFSAMLFHVMLELARMIVLDGEGSTKFITIQVINAATESSATKAARKIANSPLVKTAFFGGDFNWGRIMAALGSAGVPVNARRIGISYNGLPAVCNGQAVTENIPALKRTVKKKAVTVTVDLNSGSRSCDIMTCDLSYDYVKINADYTS